MRTFKFYQVKPSVDSKNVWMFSGNRELMEKYAQEMNGVVVEKVVIRC